MVVALIALFVALSGGAYAALRLPAASVGTAQLARGAVTEGKLRDGAVSARKIKAGSLLAKDFKAGQLPAGATGPQGPAGPVGPQGPTGPLTGSAGGALTGSYPNPQIAAGAVGSTQLAAGAVTGAKVAAHSLTGASIASSTLGEVPSAESAEYVTNPAGAGLEQGEGRTITTSGAVHSGPEGASNGEDAFQAGGARVSIVCGHGHPTIASNAAVEVENTGAGTQPIKTWVDATTTNSTFSGLHTYNEEDGGFAMVGLSAAPQQLVIQGGNSSVAFTTVLSISYTPAAHPEESAVCEWSATTTVAR
jgi:hypothetical protein